MSARLRPVVSGDAAAIAAIYNHYVARTTITFEEEPVAVEEMAARIREIDSASLPWLVVEDGGEIVGYAYAGKWKARAAYRFAAEISVYLREDSVGRGLGSRLYEAIFEALDRAGFHVVIGGVALPNEASVRLHERLGMKKVAHFEQVGFKFGKWIDVAYWQRTLRTGEAR